MARRASNDTYTTVESSVVTELTELLGETIALQTCTPLFLDAHEWREMCQYLPRVAHLVARECGFRLEGNGDYYTRRANLPLGREERGVDLTQIKDRVRAVIDTLDPKGILNAMQVAA